MSSEDLFARLLEFEERWNRMAPRFGLVFARVRGRTAEGFELDYLSTSMDAPSTPARLASPMAGGSRGMYFAPEDGDEVVVGFECGDINRPVVLGALWNDEHEPPSQADQSTSNNKRTIVSRAGHEITFDDTPGAGGISIKTAGGFEIKIDGSQLSISTNAPGPASRIILDGIPWGTHVHPAGSPLTGPPQAG